MHGLSTEPVPVSAYVRSSKNLKDLKDLGLGSAEGVDAVQNRLPLEGMNLVWGLGFRV